VKQAQVTIPGEDTQTSKGEQTRRAVLDAAIARFGREGYRATSVADIARDASVGGTVAYAYFRNKESLFLAAVDEDAAGVIQDGLTRIIDGRSRSDWHLVLFDALLEAVGRHPLAGRLLAGLEPEVTDRVLTVPALADLRRACADLLRSDQAAGLVRPDIDPVVMANGVIAIMLSLLMSVVRLGPDATTGYADDIAAVFQAALRPAGGP
jgi:AcrR family transcriptional regulator